MRIKRPFFQTSILDFDYNKEHEKRPFLVLCTFLSAWRIKSSVLFKYWNCNKTKHWQKANWFFQTLYRKKYLILIVQIIQYYYWFSCNIIIFNFQKVFTSKIISPHCCCFSYRNHSFGYYMKHHNPRLQWFNCYDIFVLFYEKNSLLLAFESIYSRMDQLKFAENSL